MLLSAIFSSSLSLTPTLRPCFSRKYRPASISTLLGTRPTISVPVTLSPRAWAFAHTSSKALCSGVALMSVMFMLTWAMPYSSMYQPMALQPLRVPGIQIWFPSASLSRAPVSLPPSRALRPFSRTSKATEDALRVEVVLRLKFTATRKFRAPTFVAPHPAAISQTAASAGVRSAGLAWKLSGPKSGLRAGSAIFSARASYSPARHTARFFLSGMYAAAS